MSLVVRKMPLDLTSEPYEKVVDAEGLQIKKATQEALEQPDGELQDYGIEGEDRVEL